MVEMLGVLALMGVLAIGGIMGYRWAMDKYQSNEIINEVKKRAIIISQKLMVGRTVDTPEFKSETEQGYPVQQLLLSDNFFAITLSDIPQGVCEQIVRADFKLPIAIYVGDTIAQNNADICQETNRIQFEFTSTLGASAEKPEHCTKKSDCSSKCDDCIDGVCQESCPDGQECGIDINNAHSKVCCSTDKMIDGFCCSSVSENEKGEKTCCVSWNGLCCPPGQFMPNKNNGQCIDCYSETVFYFPAGQACSMCPNRVSDSAFYCRLECPEGMIEVNGVCKCPIDKPLHGVNSQGGRCYACDEGNDDGYVWDNPVGMTGVGTACNWCNFAYGGGYCRRCADGTVSVGGKCEDCSTVEVGSLQYKAQCESCGGTWTGEWNNGTCTPPTSG